MIQPAADAVGSGHDDVLLTARAAEGDQDAFAVLVTRHAPRLVRLAVRLLGDKAEAEDAVQESFINAWRRLPDFRGHSAFGTWMYRVVTNRCLNALRARRPTTPLHEVLDVAAADHSSSPSRMAESRAIAADLRTALAGLSAEQAVCWVLRELDGRSYEFIADAVGITENAARARVFRARRGLTHALGDWR